MYHLFLSSRDSTSEHKSQSWIDAFISTHRYWKSAFGDCCHRQGEQCLPHRWPNKGICYFSVAAARAARPIRPPTNIHRTTKLAVSQSVVCMLLLCFSSQSGDNTSGPTQNRSRRRPRQKRCHLGISNPTASPEGRRHEFTSNVSLRQKPCRQGRPSK